MIDILPSSKTPLLKGSTASPDSTSNLGTKFANWPCRGHYSFKPLHRLGQICILSFCCCFEEVPVQKSVKHFITGLVKELSLQSLLFPFLIVKCSPEGCCCLMIFGISTSAEKWKQCTFKGTESKITVPSGFKVTELVSFRLCFAELNEKDLIECYCLEININRLRIPQSFLSPDSQKNFRWSFQTQVVSVHRTWVWTMNWVTGFRTLHYQSRSKWGRNACQE